MRKTDVEISGEDLEKALTTVLPALATVNPKNKDGDAVWGSPLQLLAEAIEHYVSAKIDAHVSEYSGHGNRNDY
jgi:hypothetical protein